MLARDTSPLKSALKYAHAQLKHHQAEKTPQEVTAAAGVRDHDSRQCARACPVKCPTAVDVAASITFIVAAFDNGGLSEMRLGGEVEQEGSLRRCLDHTSYNLGKSTMVVCLK